MKNYIQPGVNLTLAASPYAVDSGRIGATALITAIVGAYVENDPCPILAVQPTLDDARDFVVSTIEPTFAASPSLAGLLTRTKAKSETILSRRFPGGSFKCVAAVGRMLRRHTVRVLVMDECDAFEPVPGEGSPLKIAEKRTLSYDIDSGDGNVTDIVYSFTRQRFGRRVVSVKGHDGNRPLIERSSKPWLYIVGVDGAKSRLFGLLEKPGHVRFATDLPPRFFEELCSERRVTFYKFGQPRKRWERIKGMRAEALDGFIYAMAVRGLVGVDFTRRENELRTITKPASAPTVWRSKWMEGRE